MLSSNKTKTIVYEELYERDYGEFSSLEKSFFEKYLHFERKNKVDLHDEYGYEDNEMIQRRCQLFLQKVIRSVQANKIHGNVVIISHASILIRLQKIISAQKGVKFDNSDLYQFDQSKRVFKLFNQKSNKIFKYYYLNKLLLKILILI